MPFPPSHPIRPRQLLPDEEVVSRWKLLRVVEAAGRDVDVLRAFHGFVRQRSAAGRAKRPPRFRRRPVTLRSALRPSERFLFDGNPRYGLCPGRASAILAVAIAGEFNKPPCPITHLAAIASAGDGHALHLIACIDEVPTSDCLGRAGRRSAPIRTRAAGFRLSRRDVRAEPRRGRGR